MCNVKHIIEDVANYFTSVLGEKVVFKPTGKDLQGKIPVSVSYGTVNKALRWLVLKDLITMDGMREQISVVAFGVGTPKDMKENAGGKSGNVMM